MTGFRPWLKKKTLSGNLPGFYIRSDLPASRDRRPGRHGLKINKIYADDTWMHSHALRVLKAHFISTTKS